MNGWSVLNNDLRQKIVDILCKDILCVCETHLSKGETLTVNGYTWFGFNRDSKHRRSPITFGGVGTLVKNSLLKSYNVEVVDKSFDGVLGVRFVSKLTKYSFVVYSCYLPPDNSSWAEPDKFF